MFISSCPLRVSLFGGSTDSPAFIEKHGYGSVINFSCNLNTYVTLTQDALFGFNQHGHKYILNYSRREEVSSISDIQNDLMRGVLEHFDLPPVSVSLTSDVYSHGSGLASSSSYIISMIKSISMFNEMQLSDNEIVDLAYQIELKMNRYCGFQDPYGCGIPGFKRIEWTQGGIKHEYLPQKFFRDYDAHLVFTGVTRNSAAVLEDVAKNTTESWQLLNVVDKAYSALKDEDYELFIGLITVGWQMKKDTSRLMVKNSGIKELDLDLYERETVLAHKLCGAGNGGFFLVISEKDKLDIPHKSIKINVGTTGINGSKYGVL